jgi:hypothetical protein
MTTCPPPLHTVTARYYYYICSYIIELLLLLLHTEPLSHSRTAPSHPLISPLLSQLRFIHCFIAAASRCHHSLPPLYILLLLLLLASPPRASSPTVQPETEPATEPLSAPHHSSSPLHNISYHNESWRVTSPIFPTASPWWCPSTCS